MLAKFSPFCRCHVWKLPDVLKDCKKAWCGAIFPETIFRCKRTGASFITQRCYVKNGVRMASQMDLHNLSSLADKRDMANPLHSDEYLFQVTFAVVSCRKFFFIEFIILKNSIY